jgi:DNA-binding XRE family transcriptional regulator
MPIFEMRMSTAEKKRKKKIPAIAGLWSRPMSANYEVVANPTHRKLLGQAIRSRRKNAKLTQERLGELAQLNPKYIGEVERMEKTISVDALVRIAKAIGVHVHDLVRDF